MIQAMMASTEEVGEEPAPAETENDLDPDSKEYQRNAAEINQTTEKETQAIHQLAQATGE